MISRKEKIEALVAKGETKAALVSFSEFLPKGHELSDAIALLSSRLHVLNKGSNLGISDQAEQNLEGNRISNSILNLLKEWDDKDQYSPLEYAIRNLPIPVDVSIDKEHLVNCDRRTPVKRFRRAFNSLRDQQRSFQFYFLCGCPNEMPGSFAERLIYQFVEEEADDHQLPIDYRKRENVDNRVKIEKFPLGSDLAASRKKFKAYVQERFHFADTQSFESFIETGVPKLPNSHVVSVFELSYKDWEDDEGEISSYFQWMIDTFKSPHKEVPTFLFFFVVKIPNLHLEHLLSREQNKVLTELADLCTKNESALIKELKPVEITDVEEWFSEEIKIKNPNLIRPVLDALELSLSQEEVSMLRSEAQIHMKDVEQIQQAIYHFVKQ